jgi:hypothetical protein
VRSAISCDPLLAPGSILHMKRSIFLFALVGFVGCFLPLALGMSWFNMRHFDVGWTVWAVLAAYAIPMFVAGSDESDRTAAIVGTACFGYIGYKFAGDVTDLVLHGSIGGILMGVALIGGLLSSLAAFGSRAR